MTNINENLCVRAQQKFNMKEDGSCTGQVVINEKIVECTVKGCYALEIRNKRISEANSVAMEMVNNY